MTSSTDIRPVHTIPTAREMDVLRAAARGCTNDEIAALLGISKHSIRDHWRMIYTRYGVHTRTQAVLRAIALGDVALHAVGGMV